jgi:hypothetical protein
MPLLRDLRAEGKPRIEAAILSKAIRRVRVNTQGGSGFRPLSLKGWND